MSTTTRNDIYLSFLEDTGSQSGNIYDNQPPEVHMKETHKKHNKDHKKDVDEKHSEVPKQPEEQKKINEDHQHEDKDVPVIELPVMVRSVDAANHESAEYKKKSGKKNVYKKKSRKSSRKILTGATEQNKVNRPLNMKVSQKELEKVQRESQSSAWLLLKPENASEAEVGKVTSLNDSNSGAVSVVGKQNVSALIELHKDKSHKKKHSKKKSSQSETVVTEPPAIPKIPISPELVIEKMKVIEFLASNIHVEMFNETHSKSGRSTREMCNKYKLEGSDAYHKTRLTFGDLFGNLNNYSRNDITLVTQMTAYRMQILDTMASHWDGPISVAIQVSPKDFRNLGQLFNNSQNILGRSNIDIHIVVEKGVSLNHLKKYI